LDVRWGDSQKHGGEGKPHHTAMQIEEPAGPPGSVLKPKN
jgi:hypothetical protein